MRQAGSIVADAHAKVRDAIRPGVSTWELDAIAEEYIRSCDALPTFKGYYNFPATLCISINHEVVHGIPSKDRILEDGDVVSIDAGATYQGLIADSAHTHPVGTVDPAILKLLDATRESLWAAIDVMKPGTFLEDVSGAVEDVCTKYGYGLVRQYGGHGVGRKLHEEPFVSNFRTGVRGPELKPGHVLAIEPMFNLGTEDVYTLDDQWTVVTADGKPSAHFEHSIAITDDGNEVLTRLS